MSRFGNGGLKPREERARLLADAIMYRLHDHIAPRLRRDAHGMLMDLLMEEGIEIVTDEQRRLLELPPRNGDGWTREELLVLEMAQMTPPSRLIVTIGDDGIRGISPLKERKP